MPNPQDYTVGWICALTTEYVAAKAFLDEEHGRPDWLADHDNNIYTLGKIQEHNVVVAVLPEGEYGIASAASVAKDMLHSFASIRISLLVGIGGGAPNSKHDIRLGDIVVSIPRDGNGGVVQYDYGKTIQGRQFRTTGHLNQPPASLLAAVSVLKAQYESEGHQLKTAINEVLETTKWKRLKNRYGQPARDTDRLYKSHVIHPLDTDECDNTCGQDNAVLFERKDREEGEDDPVIHYGLIASANQLMKDALVRDKLSKEKNMLCFEMEAAGLMNQFPCLVIRGIADYSDTHKNDKWQGYAAMAAAAYTKDLLGTIPPTKSRSGSTVRELIGLHDVAVDHRNIALEQLKIQQELSMTKSSKKEEKCLQLFRLTTSSRDATYEWYKERLEECVPGTCSWFLEHEYYLQWLQRRSGPLVVTADPGCGKSVLAKYLIDIGLPRSTTICYFFFTAQDQNTTRKMLCAILHQLFTQQRYLIQHAMDLFHREGEKLIACTVSLWKILQNATQDPRAEPIIIVLDALDECDGSGFSEFRDLVKGLGSLFDPLKPNQNTLRLLLTCRPYEKVVSGFRRLLKVFPNVHIRGEEESQAISQEVSVVIRHRINRLSQKLDLPPKLRSHLEQKLQETTHRTYLWAYLMFEHLENEDIKKTTAGLDSAISMLPIGITEAYEQILERSTNRAIAQRVLSMILVAIRPLTLSEINIAVNMNSNMKDIQQIDLDDEESFIFRLRGWCGLLVTLQDDRVYLIHQTAREFLLAESTATVTVSPNIIWQHSISKQNAHGVLASICILYVDLCRSKRHWNHSNENEKFLDYASEAWDTHYREAGEHNGVDTTQAILRLCNLRTRIKYFWRGTPESSKSLILASHFGLGTIVKLLLDNGEAIDERDSWGQTPLSHAAMMGHDPVVEQLLDKGAYVDRKDHNTTPLWWAVKFGHDAVIDRLLRHNADTEVADGQQRTPILLGASKGHDAVVRLLVENGANIEARDNSHSTPLLRAAQHGYDSTVQLLLSYGADPHAKDKYGHAALWWAAFRGHLAISKILCEHIKDINGGRLECSEKPMLCAIEEGRQNIVEMLLEMGTGTEASEVYLERPPLCLAAEKGQNAIVTLFLERGTTIDMEDPELKQTSLTWAAKNGHLAVVECLLAKGASIESEDKNGRTALWWAAENDHPTVVGYLLAKGAMNECPDHNGQSLLSSASRHGRDAVAERLCESSSTIESTDKDGRTPLSWAAGNGHHNVVKILLRSESKMEPEDKDGRTPLSWAAGAGHNSVVQLLCDKGADICSADHRGWSPMWHALSSHHQEVALTLLDADRSRTWFNVGPRAMLECAAWNFCKLTVRHLLMRGARIQELDGQGRTLLLQASEEDNTYAVKLFLEKGADIDWADQRGQTSLSKASERGHENVVRCLVRCGARIELADDQGRSPLMWAAWKGQHAVVEVLLRNGANIDCEDRKGRTPEWYAHWGGHKAVEQLLSEYNS